MSWNWVQSDMITSLIASWVSFVCSGALAYGSNLVASTMRKASTKLEEFDAEEVFGSLLGKQAKSEAGSPTFRSALEQVYSSPILHLNWITLHVCVDPLMSFEIHTNIIIFGSLEFWNVFFKWKARKLENSKLLFIMQCRSCILRVHFGHVKQANHQWCGQCSFYQKFMTVHLHHKIVLINQAL